VKIRACAKINRSLTVLGRRPDGYHELRTVFQSLALHDTLDFEAAPGPLSIACDTHGIPLDERNLVWKAARLVWRAAGRDGEPVGRIRITKRIPAQGGLGGGSSDGAAALVGWNRLWGTAVRGDALRQMALQLGADVPFFLVGGTALGLDRGDALEPLDDLPPRWVVLVFPPFGVSTPEAFGWWDEDSESRESRVESRESAVESRESSAESWSVCVNDLEPPVTRRHPELVEVRRLLAAAGAEQVAMTGSGSTMFGLFVDATDAQSAVESLCTSGWNAAVTRTATREESALR
jgi:4-diphosphocytidyl-2-C-methyl-D-erythritol kinase